MKSPLADTEPCAKRNESEPHYLAYYKHLVSDLFSSDGLSESTEERLKVILDQSAARMNQELDGILDKIVAVFQIESDLREKELSYYMNAEYQDIAEPLCGGKRKASSLPISDNSISSEGTSRSQSVAQVYQNIQALHGNGEVTSDAVEEYSFQLCSKIGQMEQELEEYISGVVSKSRPMTQGEKYTLAQRIRKLPNKALDRVVELIQLRDLKARNFSNDTISFNLEEQDDITLWRLYYYVETVMKANKL